MVEPALIANTPGSDKGAITLGKGHFAEQVLTECQTVAVIVENPLTGQLASRDDTQPVALIRHFAVKGKVAPESIEIKGSEVFPAFHS